jgi:hypothetical protein
LRAAAGNAKDRLRKYPLRGVPAAHRVGIVRGEQNQFGLAVVVVDLDRRRESAQQRRRRRLADVDKAKRLARLPHVQHRRGGRARARLAVTIRMQRQIFSVATDEPYRQRNM